MSQRRDVQIIPPARLPDAHNRTHYAPPAPPSLNLGGAIDTTLTRWEAVRHTRAIQAIATRTRAQSDLYVAQTQAIGSYIERERALQQVRELPELLAADCERRRLERREDFRNRQHAHELAEVNRRAEIVRAEEALFVAEQNFASRRAFDDISNNIARKRMTCDLLDAELSLAERYEVLRVHRREEPAPRARASGLSQETEDALLNAREQLLAHGLDTSHIDALLDKRRR